jgi:hypothetical protein
MKKLATVLTAIVMLFASTAFAMGDENVSPAVKAAFQNDFATAQKVSWEKASDFYFASFTLNNSSVDAAYSESGELVGTSRKLNVSQVPLAVSISLTKDYAEYTLANPAIELSYEGQTSYYITAENDKQVVKLKCFSNGEITVESKIKKQLVKG